MLPTAWSVSRYLVLVKKKSAPVRCLSSKFFDQLFSVITAMRVVGAVCLGMPPSHVVTGPNVSVHSAVH